jgi:hypothetical protein
MNLSECLSYTCIANDTILSLKKNRISAILEMHVSTIECEEIMQNRHDRVMKLLMDFPDDSIVSIYFTKNFINQDISHVNSHQNKIINFLEKKRNETLLARNPSTFKCFMALSIPLTESKVDKGGIELLNILSSSNNSDTSLDVQRSIIKKAKKRLDSLVNGFKNSVDNRAFRLNSTQIAQFLSLILNHTYLDNFTEFSDVFKSDFISSYNNILDNRRGGFVCKYPVNHVLSTLRG